jgi:polyhydroxyalkanoate synthase subunit PhaC
MPKKYMESSADLAKAMAKFYAKALMKPDALMKTSLDAMQETLRSFTGNSEVAPERGDKRFSDAIWTSNPAYKMLKENYLTWTRAMNTWVEGLDLDQRDMLRAKLLTSMVTDTIAPTNSILGNPEAMKHTLETGGKNLIQGTRNFISDMVHNDGLPSMVDKSKFEVGGNLGVSKGKVVMRNDLLELIQYAPTTEKVFSRPIFIIPPQINKFYVWDLAPGRSIVEYLTGLGHQVFIVSWRNPGPKHSDWNMETYVGALDEASAVACDISGSKDLNFVGACSGGITAALLLAYWAAKDIKRAFSFSLLVAIIDVDGAKNTAMGLFANLETLEIARMFSKSAGVLPGKDLQKAFAWLRPNDLIWAYWVNNYLLGKEPPAFDILFWNADTTNLPAALHEDMLRLLKQGGLKDGNSWTIMGQPIQLGAVTCDKFIVGGTTDHITPWDGCYLSRKAFGGNNEFVLSQAGHIQSLINPPGNPKAVYMTNVGTHATSDEFLAGATKHQGSWWTYWAEWLNARGGTEIAAPKSLGSKRHVPTDDAPGTYVRELV